MKLTKKHLNCSIKLIIFLILTGAIASCTHIRNENGSTQVVYSDSISANEDVIAPRYKLFDVEIKKDDDEQSILLSLEKRGVIKVDSIKISDNDFQYAKIEFAGIKFGMNHGFIFITSQQDEETINSLVNKISEYYGAPFIDGEGDDEPEWCYYYWNSYKPEAPYIRIRPLKSDEGGLTMLWQF